MNIIDYVLIGIVFLYALIGFATGTLAQFCGLLGILVSLSAGYLFYKNTGNLFILPLVFIAASIIFKIVLYIIKKIYFSFQGKKPVISKPSRIFGSVIGLSKGTAFSFVILVFAYALSGLVAKISPKTEGYLDKSFFYSYIKQNDLLPGLKMVKNIHFANKLLTENANLRSPETVEIIRNLQENPSFKTLLSDNQLQESLKNKNYKELLSNPKFQELLKDRELLKQIYSIDYESIYNKQTR